jgi:hypothetical protein
MRRAERTYWQEQYNKQIVHAESLSTRVRQLTHFEGFRRLRARLAKNLTPAAASKSLRKPAFVQLVVYMTVLSRFTPEKQGSV